MKLAAEAPNIIAAGGALRGRPLNRGVTRTFDFTQQAEERMPLDRQDNVDSGDEPETPFSSWASDVH